MRRRTNDDHLNRPVILIIYTPIESYTNEASSEAARRGRGGFPVNTMTRTFLIAVAASAFLLTAAPEWQQTASAPEISTQEGVAVFQSKVTLIEVPVVVRDKHDKAVSTLRQQDFQLFDEGKPQMITKFSVEKSGGGKAIAQASTPETVRAPGDKGDSPAVIVPDHLVGLLFDDIHINFADLVAARTAAQKFIASGLKLVNRIAIFTTSGQTTLDFTDDRDLLNKTLLKLAPHPLGTATTEKCPSLSIFQADQMINVHNSEAIGIAVLEVRSARCYGPYIGYDSALGIATGRARIVLEEGRRETNANIVNLKEVIRKMAEMPGQRTLILVSPGFIFMQDQFQDEGPAIDLAIRSDVVITALDVKVIRAPETFGVRDKLNREADVATSGILDDLSSGTGGRSFHDNFLEIGLQELGAAPDAFYVLGFSPQNLKLDGTFHSLKASLKTPAGMSVQARRGYYAPTHLASAEEDAKEEITQALYSRDEMNEIPVEMNTRFFEASELEARLSVTSRVDVRKLRFRKSDDRNVNDVRVVCALFHRDGNYVQSVSKTIQMRLLDGALQNDKLSGGISVRSDFTVAPGTYVIRLVVRDAEGQTMTAQNSAVRIP
jgi:VWFA-related protein